MASKNSFSNFIKKQEHEIDNILGRITSRRARYELKILKTLDEIDFANSKLPREVLYRKRHECQKYPDFELAVKRMKKSIVTTKTFPVDTKQLDKKILEIAEEFKSAIAEGNVKTALAARNGLHNCIVKVRQTIPYKSKKAVDIYVQNAVNYADAILALIGLAVAVDAAQRRINDLSSKLETVKNEIDDLKEAFTRDVIDLETADSEKHKAFIDIVEKTYHTEDKSCWFKVRRDLVSIYKKENALKLICSLYEHEMDNLILKKEQFKSLQITTQLPDSIYPDIAQNYSAVIKDTLIKIRKLDVEIDKSLSHCEPLEFQLDDMAENSNLKDDRIEIHERSIEEYTKQNKTFNDKVFDDFLISKGFDIEEKSYNTDDGGEPDDSE